MPTPKGHHLNPEVCKLAKDIMMRVQSTDRSHHQFRDIVFICHQVMRAKIEIIKPFNVENKAFGCFQKTVTSVPLLGEKNL